MKKLISICLVVLFAVNANATTSTLVYDSGTDNFIQAAMTNLGISFDLRDAGNPVTEADLDSHDILVISWNAGGDMSGVSASVLASGITGKKLLTGHDPDYHYYWGTQAAGTFLSQAISWARGSGGSTGLVALGDDSSTAFSYLPSEWGVSATELGGDTIDSFTPEGVDSGVYNGLTPLDMSNWHSSYHATFAGWGAEFMPFEIGGATEADVVTIATPEPATICLLGLGALLLRRKR
jgi:hypothetical protein